MASEENGKDHRQTIELPKIVLDRLEHRLTGMETLDLSRAEPKPTEHLSLGKSHNVRFQRKSRQTPGSAWQLDAEDDELVLLLTLPYKHGVNLIVELCRTKPGKTDAPPVVITVNDQHELDVELDRANLNFQKQAWYVPQYMLDQGQNRIALKLAPEAGTEILLRSASVMRFDLQPQEKSNWCFAAVTASLNQFFAHGRPIRQREVVSQCLEEEEPSYKITEQTLTSLKEAGVSEDVLESLRRLLNLEVRDEDRFQSLLKIAIEDDLIPKGVSLIMEHARNDNRPLIITNAFDLMGLHTMRCSYPISLDEIRRQMQLGLPVVIRVESERGTGHFAVITGVCPRDATKDDRTMVRVADPSPACTDPVKGTTIPIYIAYNMLKKHYRDNRVWTHTYLFEKEREHGQETRGRAGASARAPRS